MKKSKKNHTTPEKPTERIKRKIKKINKNKTRKKTNVHPIHDHTARI